MTSTVPQAVHRHLANGIELGVLPIPARPVAAMEIRFFGGYAYESPDCLGIAHVLHEAISKGTAKRDGRALNDAFDAIGATHAVYAGRETIGFSSMCLPEFINQVIDLHGEMICTPSFPDDACAVAVELTEQALAALDDDPHDLARKLLNQQAYGQPLGRHTLGESGTLKNISRERIVEHWQRHFTPKRMQVAIAGNVDTDRLAALLEETFAPLASHSGADGPTRPEFAIAFDPVRSHHDKDTEQEQVGFCFPGAAAQDDDFQAEQVVIGVLAGGMSGRLFTEVREKQGLVYWVGASADRPRNSGMVHIGASTTPERVDKTYQTLLREVDRLAEDVTEQEIERAIVGLVARTQTRGDITRAKATELVNDLFYHSRPIPTEEKIDKVKTVDIKKVRDYLNSHPRDQLSVVTLGPRAIEG
jgi:predicted Zn-dependent peptidase